jgi:hypothetical protein
MAARDLRLRRSTLFDSARVDAALDGDRRLTVRGTRSTTVVAPSDHPSKTAFSSTALGGSRTTVRHELAPNREGAERRSWASSQPSVWPTGMADPCGVDRY